MTPEQEQALKAHLEAIAQILYDESDPEAMKTLEGIESLRYVSKFKLM